MNNYECIIHKNIEVPEDAAVYFVGDIHGQFDILQHLLKSVSFDFTKDYLISVGDLIDRGPKNLETLAYFAGSHPRRFAAMGNHDAFMACAPFSESAMYTWLYNGGQWIIDNGYSTDDLASLSQMVRSNLPVFITVRHGKRKYGVVHAAVPLSYQATGIDYEVPTWGQVIRDTELATERKVAAGDPNGYWSTLEPFMWDRNVISSTPRERIGMPPVEGVDYVFHGHTYVPEVDIIENRVHIDTGAAFRGVMTLVSPDLATGALEVFRVDNLGDVTTVIK